MLNTIKYLVAGDVHGRDFWKEPVEMYLLSSKANIIFLGDYLDPYTKYEGITPEKALENFKKIIDIKKQYPERVILLLGNHDIHYIFGERGGCRMDMEHREEIMRIFLDNIDLFEVCHIDTIDGKDVVFSHAGFSKEWIASHPTPFLHCEKGMNLRQRMALVDVDLLRRIDWKGVLLGNNRSVYNDCGWYRGGMDNYSSCVWCDRRELMFDVEPVDCIQIFGHTLGTAPKKKNELYCLDCRRCFLIDSKCNVTELDGTRDGFIDIDGVENN